MTEQLNLIPEEHYTIRDTIVALDELPADEALISPPPDRAFVNDIRANGVAVPILIEVDLDGSPLDVVDGRRRVKAAREIGLEELPARYAIGAPRDWLVGRAIALNDKRSPNPLSEYENILELLSLHPDLSPKQIAKGLGMRVDTVEKRLKLRALHPPLLGVIASGDMAVSTGERLAARPLDDQIDIFRRYEKERFEEGKARITGKAVDKLREVDDRAGAQTLFDLGVFDTPAADDIPADLPRDTSLITELEVIVAEQWEPGTVADRYVNVISRLEALIERLKSQDDLPF